MLKEADIRPDELQQQIAEASMCDAQWLLEQMDQDFGSVIAFCPACAGDVIIYAHRVVKNGFTYDFCARCQTVYMRPRPVSRILKRFYEGSENYKLWNDKIFPASEDARRISIFKPRALRVQEFCLRYNIKTDVLVDVGAGFGTFCEEMSSLRLFDRIIAVEPTPALTKTCIRRDIETYSAPIEGLEFCFSVNVIVSFEVIEHLFNPAAFLHDCYRLLGEDGLLILTCPNVKGFDVATLGVLSDTFDHEHLTYFHPDSLTYLLTVSGFKVLEILTPGELDAELVRKKALDGIIDLTCQPFLKRVLIDEWEELGEDFQQFLADNLLSSHMWVVAQKKELGSR